MNTATPHLRGIEQLVRGQATQDGAGVKLTRVFGQDLQQRLDPFLMLDHFASDDPNDYGAGFPDHPHRGFETITYMVAGRMRHQDSAGNTGLLQSGGVQWMTAGRGLIHSEMPQQESGVMEGFQLWLNLPAKDKLCTPWYRDIQSADIPELLTSDADGKTGAVKVRVIAGTSHGVQGAMHRSATAFPTNVLYLDLHFLQNQAPFTQTLTHGQQAFIYVYRGKVVVTNHQGQNSTIPPQHLAVLENTGNAVQLQADNSSTEPARALLIAGQPLREPIAQYGPFVMNTREELLTAVHDFQNGRMG